MSRKSAAELLKSPMSRMEAKQDATNRIARETIAQDAKAASAKIDRLKAARLAREADEAANPPPKKKAKS